MNHIVSVVNASAAPWADALVRACWQGGLGIALVWLLCRLWPGMPPVPRCRLWRLAYAKLLLGLVWLPPLALPLLPHPPAMPPPAQAVAPLERHIPALKGRATRVQSPSGAEENNRADLTPADLPSPHALTLAPPPPARPTLPTTQTWLLAAWLLGVLVSLGRVATAWRRAYILYGTSAPPDDEALRADAADLCRRLGLPHVPPLRVADGLASPVLLGLTRPAILLPAFVLSDVPRSELRLMLAHELAHLARRDLLWNCLPLLARLLFWFHPLVWLAAHEWALAQEIACDAQAVHVTGTPPSAYGRMLLGIATRRRTPAASLFPTLAVAAPRHTLRRRLFAMQHIGTVSRPRALLAAALTLALAVVGLLPWRVVAQSTPPPFASPAASQTEDAMMEKNRVEIASRSAKLDEEFADFLKHLSPAQQKNVQAEAAFLTTEVAKSQQHVQMLEQHRAAYVAAHPNRLTAAQIAEVQRINWQIREPDRISEGIRWEQIIKGKLQAHLAASRDARSRTGWQRQIAAIDQRRRESERQIRDLEPSIVRKKAELETIPADQRARVAKLRSYDSEISAYRNFAVMMKEVELSFLRDRLAGKLPARRQSQRNTDKTSLVPLHASAASSGYTARLYCFPGQGHRIRIFTQDATGQHLILDKLSGRGPVESPPVPVTNRFLARITSSCTTTASWYRSECHAGAGELATMREPACSNLVHRC